MKKVKRKKILLLISLLIILGATIVIAINNKILNIEIKEPYEAQVKALVPKTSYTAADFDNQDWLTDEIARQIGHGGPWTHAEIQTIKTLDYGIGAINPGWEVDTHIPDGIGYLIGLEEIDIGDNRLTGNLYQIAELPNLKFLRITGCELSGNIPSFTNCPDLYCIDLYKNSLAGYYNGLTGNIPEFNLPKLTYFRARQNSLTGSVPSFKNCPLISTIDIAYNKLNGTISSFAGLQDLKAVMLAGNQLTGSIPEFTNCPTINSIYLNSNELSGNIPNFTNHPNLVGLNLKDNYLTGIIPELPESCYAPNFDNNYLVTSTENQYSIPDKNVTIKKNQTYNFASDVKNNLGASITAPFDTATSSNMTAATVSGTTITGLSEGTTTIKYKMTGSAVTGNDNAILTINLTVIEVKSIVVKTQPTTLNYIEGQTLDLAGLIATLTYSDLSTEDVPYANFANKNITASPANGTALSVTSNNGKPVTLTCNGKTANTSNLTVIAKTVTEISVKTQPATLNYIEGQTLDLTGLVATLTYNDGSTEDVAFANFTSKGITANPTNGTALSVISHHNKPVVLTCDSKTANTSNLTVVAKAVTGISVKTQPTTLSYIEGQALNLSGLVATLIYNDLSTEDVPYANFTNKNITASPANGTALSVISHHNKPVVLTCDSKTANTSNLTVVTTTSEVEIDTSTYTLDDNFIKNITPNTNVVDLLDNLTCNYEIKVYDKNDQEITEQTLIGTGMKIVANGQEYILVVKGDTNGSGKVDLNDAIRMLQHRAGGTNPQLTGPYLKAAELTTDGQVTLNDVIKVMRYKATNGAETL